MTNPFDDNDAEYLVLVNEEGQYSLWPAHVEIPKGWTATGPRGKRQVCLEWVDANWIDLRPNSPIGTIDAAARLHSNGQP